eukprot:13038999-Alexandrium_andersonii.AAC.1
MQDQQCETKMLTPSGGNRPNPTQRHARRPSRPGKRVKTDFTLVSHGEIAGAWNWHGMAARCPRCFAIAAWMVCVDAPSELDKRSGSENSVRARTTAAC